MPAPRHTRSWERPKPKPAQEAPPRTPTSDLASASAEIESNPGLDPVRHKMIQLLQQGFGALSDGYLAWVHAAGARERLVVAASPPAAPALPGEEEDDVLFGAPVNDLAPEDSTPAPPARSRDESVLFIALTLSSPLLRASNGRGRPDARAESAFGPLQNMAERVLREQDGLVTFLLSAHRNPGVTMGRVLSFLMEFERTQNIAAPAVAAATARIAAQGDQPAAFAALVDASVQRVRSARPGEVLAPGDLVDQAHIGGVFSRLSDARARPQEDLRSWTFARPHAP